MSAKKTTVESPSPGALLREQRGDNGWSLDDVARALNLSVAQLEALENDDYAKLPGKTYIVGYWKSYAALLHISIDDAINAHKQTVREPDTVIALDLETQKLQGNTEKSHHASAFLFVLLSVVFLAAIWYWQNPQTGGIYNWLTQTEQTGQTGQRDVAESAAENQLAAEYKVLPEPNFPDHNDVPADTEIAETQTTDHPLVFSVSEASWLEVRDAAGQQLIHRNVPAGRYGVAGTPPFAVYIGNADGVAVEYLGQPFRFPRSGGVFARFTVGAPSQ